LAEVTEYKIQQIVDNGQIVQMTLAENVLTEPISQKQLIMESVAKNLDPETKEGIRWALDAAGNTGQYIKFVNMTIDKRQNQINKIKTLQGKFDKEIELLKSNKLEKIKETQSSLAAPDIHTVGDYLNQILLEKRITQSNLQNLQKDLGSMEKELKLQETQIEGVRAKIKAKIIQGNNKEITTIDAIKIIRDELSSIATKYDVSKLSMAVDKVVSSKATL